MTTPFDAKDMKWFTCRYPYAGHQWCLNIFALDFEDAEARMAAITLGKVDGILIMEIPARLGFGVKLVIWLRNLFRGKIV